MSVLRMPVTTQMIASARTLCQPAKYRQAKMLQTTKARKRVTKLLRFKLLHSIVDKGKENQEHQGHDANAN